MSEQSKVNQTETLTFGLVLPEAVVHHHFSILMKRRNKPNMPQFLLDKFDGDEHQTKFWIEEQEGEWKLMSHYEGRPYNQNVYTMKEMLEQQKNDSTAKAVSTKAKVLQLLMELGSNEEEALESACNFANNHNVANPLGSTKRMIGLFILMKQRNIKAEVIRITPGGNLMLGVKPEYEDQMREISAIIGFSDRNIQRFSEEEENEDPI